MIKFSKFDNNKKKHYNLKFKLKYDNITMIINSNLASIPLIIYDYK